MKNSSEYRALAWQEYRAHTSQSLGITGVALLIGALAAAVLYVSFNLATKSTIGVTAATLIIITTFFCICLINYYLPLCFLSLIRKHEVVIADIQCERIRALRAALVMFIPSLIQSIAGAMSSAGQKSPVMFVIALALFCLCIWWGYAICSMLPYIANDNRELSIWASVKGSIAMMKGYKWRLFCVDFKIAVWPVVAFFIVIVSCAMIGIFGQIPAMTNLVGILGIAFIVVFAFIYYPMMYIARAHFYEDLLAQSMPAEEKEEVEETIEVVEEQ